MSDTAVWARQRTARLKAAFAYDRPVSFGGTRHDYVHAALKPRNPRRILDVGCGHGWTLAGLKDLGADLVGIDTDPEVLASARATYPFLEIVESPGGPLPFPDGSFDAVICSDVIEHVGDENKAPLLREIHRVLEPGGTLVLTAPHAGILSWADPMDLKRKAAGLYRLYARVSGYRSTTEARIGHKHISRREAESLLDGFVVEDMLFSGAFTSALTWPIALAERLPLVPERVEHVLARFRAQESGVRLPRLLADNIRLTARRV